MRLMERMPRALASMTLYLTYVSDDRVEFEAHVDDKIHRVSVIVGSGMVLFPHAQHESGASLGNPYDDHAVRLRAYEELNRLRCYRIDQSAA